MPADFSPLDCRQSQRFGMPADPFASAIRVPGGGVSKVNIAADLEQAMLQALGREGRMSNAELAALPAAQRRIAGEAVAATVVDKIERFLGSAGRAG